VEVLGLIVTGALAGWVAAILVRGAGYGLVINLVVGVIGGVLGGALLRLLSAVRGGGWSGHHGWPLDLALAVAGAVLLLTLLDLIRRSR